MAENKRLTIVQMNDSHGYAEPHQEWFWVGDHGVHEIAGGYARITALIDEMRAENPGGVLAFDCGDTVHGTYAAVKSQGRAFVPILNRMGFAAMTAHWEFAYGPQAFKELTRQLDYPMLAINCYDKQTGELFFDPYTVCEAAGMRVGVIGIAATIVDKVMPPAFSEGIYFTLGNEELPGWIDKLRKEERVDLVVVISHLGFPQEVKLAREVDGIDVLLSGHTHNRIYEPVLVNNTILFQSGCHGSFLGRLDLEMDGRKIVDFRHRLIVVDAQVEPAPAVEDLIDRQFAPYRDELERVVGHTATPLNRYRVLEATMDNLLLQSLLEATGAQLAFANGWRYGAPVPRGPVTLGDLWNMIPVNPPVSTCKISGDELRAMLEENLEHTFARDPYEQMGGYVKRCMGLNLYFKVENPAGYRICELFVGQERVRPDQLYTASFVTSQGVPAKYGTERQHLEMDAIQALEHYLAHHRPVQADLSGTIVAV